MMDEPRPDKVFKYFTIIALIVQTLLFVVFAGLATDAQYNAQMARAIAQLTQNHVEQYLGIK